MRPKNQFYYVIFSLLLSTAALGNGVAIVDGVAGVYLRVERSTVNVEVNNQIALVTTSQVFRNTTGQAVDFKYGFPLNTNASPIKLRWNIDGVWEEAIVQASEQDTSIPGSSGDPGGSALDPQLTNYLGGTPLFFSPNEEVPVDSSITIELTYVELLPYSFGTVNFFYPADYTLIQGNAIIHQQNFSFTLHSNRTIDEVNLEDLNAEISNTGNLANVSFGLSGHIANNNYEVNYQLSSTELGLYDLSTKLPDSLLNCDTLGGGFFSLLIEPETNVDVTVIEKNFTLVIDRSGSMSGQKIVQAREAASFIVNNLNFGDFFNIIDFSTSVSSFSQEHLPYTLANRDLALDYISGLNASGSTNISGSLVTAINQFQAVDPNKANIIIFFTDGMATVGNTSTPGILDDVENTVNNGETNIFLFTFGIGSDVDQQLLTLLAVENNGLVNFLGNDELEEEITDFFLRINNPVLLGTTLTFEPNNVFELHPSRLPNLYEGEQLIVSGRYAEPGLVNVHLAGNAYNLPVEYDYQVTLVDSNIVAHSFLPKIWAKQKIDELTLDYYLTPSSSTQADSIEAEIDSVSICYGIVSVEFTSFEDGPDGPVTEVDELEGSENLKMEVLVSPNPFTDWLEFRFIAKENLSGEVVITIINQLGEAIAVLKGRFNGTKLEVVTWDSLGHLPPGIYFCSIRFRDSLKTIKVVKI